VSMLGVGEIATHPASFGLGPAPEAPERSNNAFQLPTYVMICPNEKRSGPVRQIHNSPATINDSTPWFLNSKSPGMARSRTYALRTLANHFASVFRVPSASWVEWAVGVSGGVKRIL
jgi:hypothetical protein